MERYTRPPRSHDNKLDGQRASLGRRKALALRLLKEGRWRPNRLLRGEGGLKTYGNVPGPGFRKGGRRVTARRRRRAALT